MIRSAFRLSKLSMHRVEGFKWTKTKLVLNKMPRDCTDPAVRRKENASRGYTPFTRIPQCTVPLIVESYRKSTRLGMNSAKNGANKKKNNNKAMHKPVVHPKPKKTRPKVKGMSKDTSHKLGGAFRNLTLGYGSIQKIMGSGTYSVKSNTVATVCGSLENGTEIPKFANSRAGYRISHREFVGELVSPGPGLPYTTFANYDISPINDDLFPWLARTADVYQQYKFHGCVVEFKSMSSEYASGAGLGTVVISTNYNANLPPYQNKLQAENSEFAVSCKPSLSQLHCIECDPRQRPTEYLYIQPETYAGSSLVVNDMRLTSFGTLQIATQGLSAAQGVSIGEIWVSYDVEFLKPAIQNTAVYPLGVNGCSITSSGAITGQLPFSATPIIGSGDINPVGITSTGAGQRITYNTPGTYMVMFRNATNIVSQPAAANVYPFINESNVSAGMTSTVLDRYGTNNMAGVAKYGVYTLLKHVVNVAGSSADYTSLNGAAGNAITSTLGHIIYAGLGLALAAV